MLFRAWLLAVAALLAFAAAAAAAPGDLDRSFGGDGIVTTSFGGGAAAGKAVARAPGGRLVVAGELDTATASRIAVARYRSNGRLDGSFGGGGRITTGFPGGAVGAGVAVQGDGRVVVVGGARNGFALVRYLPGGRLDGSFGSGGRVVTAFAGLQASGNAVVLLSGGGILVAGGVSDNQGENQGFALARYDASGRLDSAFGSGGRVVTPFGTGADVAAANAVARAGSRVVAAGLLDNPFTGGGAFTVARYRSQSGALDSSFSGDGKVATALGQEAGAQGVVVSPDGRIVAAGTAESRPGEDDFTLVRYLSGGALDASFGSGGIVTTDLPGGDAQGEGIARQRDGRLVVVGQVSDSSGKASRFGVVRYQPGGALDRSFGGDGIVLTRMRPNSMDGADAVVIQRDGRIVAAGVSGNQFALARYLAAPAPPRVAILSRTAAVGRTGITRVALRCPRRQRCRGTLALGASGSATFAFSGRRRVAIALTRAACARIARRGRMTVTAVATTRSAAGGDTVTRRRVALVRAGADSIG